MAQYNVPQNEPRLAESRLTEPRLVEPRLTESRLNEPRHLDTAAATSNVASPAPLGLSMIAFITAIIGCFYTGFIIPFDMAGMRAGVGVAALISGIILVLAGMWEFRKGYLLTSTTFTAYGGFLGLLGLMFLPNLNFMGALGGNVQLFMGLLFLCWTIFLAVLFIGSLRAGVSMAPVLGLLLVAYFFLMLGSLAGDNTTLLKIGGWFAIASAIVAWLAALASILGASRHREIAHIPFGNRLAVVE